MDWKNMVKKTCVAALAAFALMTPQASAAEEEPTIVADAPGEGEQQEMTSEEALQAYKDSGYKYTSQRYGYSIICPTKPTVVPLSVLFGDDEDARGDVLIFKSAGYDINYGWIVMVDAFDEDMIPDDITKQPEAKQKDYIEKFMANSPYEFIRLTEVDGHSGVYAVDAKEIEVDTNGDGKYDECVHDGPEHGSRDPGLGRGGFFQPRRLLPVRPPYVPGMADEDGKRLEHQQER